MSRSCSPLGSALLSALAFGAPAFAAGFDPATGTVDVADAAGAITFDDLAALQGGNMQGYSADNFDPVDLSVVAEGLDTDGIEGAGSLRLGGNVAFLTVDVAQLAAMDGRRAEIVLWQQPHGTRVTPYVEWYGNLLAGDQAPFLGRVTFLPTGNVTDDGWEEWSTGPVDWQWGGVFAPIQLSIMDAQISAYYGGASYDTLAYSLVDALHVKDLGAAAIAPSACTLVDEANTCGDDGVCQLGRCVDGAIRLGANAPLTKGAREDYLNRRLFELDHFEGGREPQERVADVRAALEGIELQAHARAYWGTLNAVYGLLKDGHASAPVFGYPAYSNAGVCIHEGTADLVATDSLNPGNVAPLVFSTGGDNVVSSQLEAGDALVSIDGIDVAQWVALAGRLIVHHGDPAANSVVLAPSIISAALDTGAVLTFARCTALDACTEFDVDLTALVGDPVVAGEGIEFFYDTAPCDNRFERPVPGDVDDVTAYEFAGYRDAQGIRSVLINGVPQGYGQAGQHWFNVIEEAIGTDDLTSANKLLLDQRTGNGGGIDAVDWIAGFLVEQDAVYGMDMLPSFEEGDDSATHDVLLSCLINQTGYDCGTGIHWVLGDIAQGARGKSAAAKLAVLNTVDVSGNDYLTRLISEREEGETRIFGPAPTFGAFGVIWAAPAHIGELSGGSFQEQDTLFLQSDDDENLDFVTGTGVPPDEVVRQKQSDAIVGTDTILERARAWLNE